MFEDIESNEQQAETAKQRIARVLRVISSFRRDVS